MNVFSFSLYSLFLKKVFFEWFIDTKTIEDMKLVCFKVMWNELLLYALSHAQVVNSDNH
jgi:hypothetical protein